MTALETANRIIELLGPLFSSGSIVARYDLEITRVREIVYPGRMVSKDDSPTVLATKILQVLSKASDESGAFYVIPVEKSHPYEEPPVPAPTPIPTWHPPCERRYWARAEFENRNPSPVVPPPVIPQEPEGPVIPTDEYPDGPPIFIPLPTAVPPQPPYKPVIPPWWSAVG